MGIFDGGPQVNESLNDSLEQTTDPLKDLEGKEVKFDGGGLYNTKNKVEDFIEPDELVNPALEKTEEEAIDEALEMYSKNTRIDDRKHITPEQMQEDIDSRVMTENEIIDDNNSRLPDLSDTGTEEEYNKNIEKENQDKIDKNPYTPIIDGLVGQDFITENEGNIIKKVIVEEGNIEEQINNIDGLDDIKKGQIIDSITYINSKEAKLKFNDKFNNDFIEDIDVLKTEVVDGEKGEKALSKGQERLLEKIGGNYYTIGAEKGGSESTKDGLNRALKITLNELIDNEQFKEPENFENIKANILDGSLDFESRFKQLQKIETQIVNSTSSLIGKQSKAFNKGLEKVKNKEATNEGKLAEYKNLIKIGIEEKDIFKLKDYKEDLELFKEDLPKGGIIESSVLDLISEINDNLKETN